LKESPNIIFLQVEDLGYEPMFSVEIQEFGVTEVRDLIANGRNIKVTEANKLDYIRLVCQASRAKKFAFKSEIHIVSK